MLDSNQLASASFPLTQGSVKQNRGLEDDSKSAAVLHKYKHIAGNPLKLNPPVLTYLYKVDKHTANYACYGIGEKSASSFPTTKT